MEYSLGLDIGTSGVKALAVSGSGQVLAQAHQSYTLQSLHPGWAEQHPDLWWRASVVVLQKILKSKKLKNHKVAAVGFSGQMHSSVFLDAQGKVIRPALLWCDGRTTDECKWITRRVGDANLRKWVSNPALEGFTLPKVLWLKRHEPAAFRRLSKVVLAKDYIRYKLSGELASDVSDAAGTLMFDVRRRRWSGELMKAVGLKETLLPVVGESSQVLSRVNVQAARVTGLPQGTPLVAGGADNACGAIGVGAVTPGSAVVSWGTSGTVLVSTRKPEVDPDLRVHTFCSAVPGQWYVMGVMLTAGAAFAWYRDQLLKEKDSLALNMEAARSQPGARGLTFLPYFQGERTPHRDASARGALVGLSLSHNRSDVSRAILEGITFGLRDSVEIAKKLKLPVKSLLLTGGGAKSSFLRKLQADVFGLPVQTVNKEEGPAFGAALLAAVGAGMHKSVELACKATLKRGALLRPDRRQHRAFDEAYCRFRALYPALKSIK